ncbi:hypothetical protein GCM10017044_06860 [Kordiimonas sediminis]|uniref:L,D-TPase catalytic domain-containing protein n=1 Tax=Kordiimonas sediminis TaxID=1735581 RepID=A0A919AMM5_9PROT|nr:L,D-transpeptidase family protein [Kordiimonas sediminis]GHF15345.1 hypothetical protein GCM10017044_06860 [Kordiimonas sediminis]
MRQYRVVPDKTDSRKGRVIGPLFEAPCALGAGGVIPQDDKEEGDGATPAGIYPFRRIYYRPDMVEEPVSLYNTKPIRPDMGWCDDVASKYYNKPVGLPFAASHEKLWRDDNLYNIIVVLGHNDAPTVPGKGSAIFMHIAREGYTPTRGCIALSEDDLTRMIRQLMLSDTLVIEMPS